jgi:hypothetical protein
MEVIPLMHAKEHNMSWLQLENLCVQPPFSAEVKNVCSYISTPPYAFMALCLNKHQFNFTLCTFLCFFSFLYLFNYLFFQAIK